MNEKALRESYARYSKSDLSIILARNLGSSTSFESASKEQLVTFLVSLLSK